MTSQVSLLLAGLRTMVTYDAEVYNRFEINYYSIIEVSYQGGNSFGL